MNKQDLINKVFDRTVILKKDVENVVNATFDIILEELANGESVLVTGFGSFDVKEAKAKNVVDLRTKEKILVPPSKSIKFHCAKKAKEQINK